MFRKAWAAYGNALVKRPLLTKMATTAVIYGAGDTFSQVVAPILTKKKEKSSYNLTRNLGQASFGMFLLGPFYHFYFKTLDTVVKASGWRGAALKLLIDQTIGCTLIICGFVTWNTMFQGGSFSDARREIMTNFYSILKLNWMVWPAAGVIVFGVVPSDYRTLFVNVVAFFWSALLSYVFSEQNTKEAAKEVSKTEETIKNIENK